MKIAFLGDIALIGKYDITLNGEAIVISRLQEIKKVLSNFDFVVANLESPLTDINYTREYKSMPLKSPSTNIKVLKYLGVNAVSLANNHIYDYGKKGLEECIEILNKNQISHFGIGQEPLYFEKDNKRIAFQGFCCYTSNGWHYDNGKNGDLNSLTYRNISTYLSKAKSNDCYPIIITHWGEENTHYPRSEHVHIAKSILEHNICSIVGHHPHVPQGVIRDENGICAFSLGNFIFDDCYSLKNGIRVTQTDDNKHGYILELEYTDDKGIIDRIIPYYDNDTGIVLDSSGFEHINKYSSAIKELYGKSEYEIIRLQEQQKARSERLGKRDVHWLMNHLNYSSVMTVIQRKMNQKNFTDVVDSFATYSNNNVFDGKVLYVGNFGLPDSDAPGKRVYANSLLLTKLGYDVLMIGTDNSVRGKCKSISDHISYISFPALGKKNGKKYFVWLKRQIERTNSKPVIIIRYGSPGLAVFDKFLYSYCHYKNIPIIVDVVDWLCVDSSNLAFKIIKGLDTFLEKGLFNKHGNGIIVISSYLYNYYINYYKNIIVIPPLVADYSSKEVCNETPQIVYAGNPFRIGERVKNVHAIKDRLDIAINSFIDLEKKGVKFDFHVIGMTMDDYLVAFPDMKESFSGIEHIHFHDRQTMERTQELISTMDFSILLREKNRGTMAGFPTKIVESLSLGVPVITTETSDLKDYIHDGINGFIVDINDQIKLEEQLANIIAIRNKSIAHMKKQIYSDKSFVIDRYDSQFRIFINNVLTNGR